MIELKDYLHNYIGCELKTPTGKVTLIGVLNDKFNGNYQIAILNGNISYMSVIDDYKPILCRLSDITDEDAKQLALIYCKEYPHQLYAKPVLDEPKRNTKYRGGGFCAAIYNDAELTQYESLIAIHFSLLNSEQFHYLLQQGFDLFSLIENGLAIDKKTLNP